MYIMYIINMYITIVICIYKYKLSEGRLLQMHVKHGPRRKVITVDWQYSKERYSEIFLARYTIQS